MDNRKLFKTPFSREYWKTALGDFKNLRIMVFAALMVALRIALKPVGIPLALDLRINAGFFVNAYGAMVFGPVVAIFAAIITDTLGYLVFPNGVYFLPFVLTEIAGSVIFALFLYRTEITATRVILSRFCIDLFVNVGLNTPIMWLYYRMMMGKTYALFDVMRIVKNLAMFPVESILLILVLRLVIPPTQKLGYVYSGTERLRFTKRNVVTLVSLLCAGAILGGSYLVYNYNHTSLSASYTAQERLQKNTEMTKWAGEHLGEESEDLVAIIESATTRVGLNEIHYDLALYQLDRAVLLEENVTEESVRGLSKSKAAAEAALTRIGSATAVTEKKSGEHRTIEIHLDQE